MVFCASAAPLPIEGVFVFSNLGRERESGDPAGFRIKIDRSFGVDSLYFEWSEGGLMGANATKLSIEPQTGVLDFTILPGGWPLDQQPAYRYTGKVSKERIVLDKVDFGAGRGFEELETGIRQLPAKPPLSKKLPACK